MSAVSNLGLRKRSQYFAAAPTRFLSSFETCNTAQLVGQTRNEGTDFETLGTEAANGSDWIKKAAGLERQRRKRVEEFAAACA
jgi:hypothetical protein